MTVLFVDDNALVRLYGATVCREAGYTVLEAAGGAEALALCRDFPETIHILVTDLRMPKMDGVQLAAAIRELRPDIRVLFSSGHTADLPDGSVFLGKPYTEDQLLDKIQSLAG